MNKLTFSIVKFSILLTCAFGFVLMHEPKSAYAVTTLTLGDGTTYFDNSNNYYTALVNACEVAESRGYVIPNVDIDYILQSYPFLEYIDGDEPSVLIDIFVDESGNFALCISSRSYTGLGYTYSDDVNEVVFNGCHTIGYLENGQFYTASPVSNKRYIPLNNVPNDGDIFQYGGYGVPSLVFGNITDYIFRYNNVDNFPLDTVLDYIERGDIKSCVLYYPNGSDSPYSVGNSCIRVQNGAIPYPRWKPVVLSTSVYIVNTGVSYHSGDTFYSAPRLVAPSYIGSEPLLIYNDVAWSVIGESLAPDIVIPLLTPSPVPTMPYNQATPTPMVVNTGIFGFGGTDVNASSDYQNALTAWIDGINKLDNIIFLRVLADTILASNTFSWILIPVSFMLIAWVWGLKPFNSKGGDEDD